MTLPPALFHFREFEFVHGAFSLPHEDFYLFRSVHPSLPMSPTQPTFFGDYEVAKFYSDGRLLKVYQPKRRIRIMDLRYIQAFLPMLWQDCSVISQAEREIIRITSIVLGLTSYDTQIKLLQDFNSSVLQPMIQRMQDFKKLTVKPTWVNPIEMRGVRCGITDIDYHVMSFLKELLGDIIDGIIAPAIPTPFHDQINQEIGKSMIYQELVLFDPSQVLHEIIPETQDLPVGDNIYMKDYIADFMTVTRIHRATRISLLQRGGRGDSTPCIVRDDFGERIHNGDEAAKKKYERFLKKARTFAAKLKKTQVYLKYYCPNFCTIGTPVPGFVRIGRI